MAYGIGSTSKGRSGAAASIGTGAISITRGSTIVVGVAWSNAIAFTSVADSVGNAYTQAGVERAPSAGTDHARLYYCQNAIGGASVTITLTVASSTSLEILAVELTGMDAVSFDQQNSNPDTASPFTSGNITTTAVARQILVSLIIGDSGSNPATHAESTGFTIQSGAEETNGVSFWAGAMATRPVTDLGTYGSSFTESGATRAAVFIASFKERSDAGARRTPFAPGKQTQPGKGKFRVATRGFTQTSGTSPITGAVGVDIAVTGSLTGTGALIGAIPIAFTPIGALTGSGALAGAIVLSITPTSTLSGIGAMTGAIPLAFTPAGTLTGTGALVGAIPLAITPTGSLTGTGALTGTVAVSFTIAGTLSAGGGAIAGSVPLDFTVVGALTGTGALSGATTVTFGVTGALSDSSAPAPSVSSYGVGGHVHKRRRLYVEIDGQQFNVDSAGEAVQLLEHARALAEKQSEEAAALAERRVSRSIKKRGADVPQIRVQIPEISVSSEISAEVAPLIADIRRLYDSAAETAELRLLFARQLAQEEDDEDVLLLI